MVVNFVGFYLAWFGLILLGNTFIPIDIALIAAHLIIVVKAPEKRFAELKLITAIVIIGLLVDNALTAFSVFNFPNTSSSSFDAFLIPLWLVVLWACFAATIAHSMQVMAKSKLLQVCVGAVFAPMSYIAGEKFGAVEFGYSLSVTFFILALVWSILLVSCFVLKDYFFNSVFQGSDCND